MYRTEFSKKAIDFTDKLDKESQNQIYTGLEKIRIRPERFLIRQVGQEFYKLRIGNFRLLIDLIRDELVILVIEIGHRKNIYKKR